MIHPKACEAITVHVHRTRHVECTCNVLIAEVKTNITWSVALKNMYSYVYIKGLRTTEFFFLIARSVVLR